MKFALWLAMIGAAVGQTAQPVRVINNNLNTTVTGAVSVGNFPTSQHVVCDSGCGSGPVDQGAPNAGGVLAWPTTVVNFPSSYAVTGTVTISNFPATQDVTQSGTWTVSATQSGSWTVDASGSSVTVGNFPATYAVTGTFWQATQPVSGTFWQATQPVSGTFFQATQPVSIASMPSTPVTGTFWQATQPVSGTFYQATQPVSLTTLPALVAGSAVIGHVVVDTAPTTAVTGTFYQSTQPVSLSTLPALTAGSAVIGHVIVDTAPSTAVTGAFWQATQPVSKADGVDVTLGAKADAKSTATDTTPISAISILKEISAVEQAPVTRAVTNAGTFAVQATQAGTWSGLRIVGNSGTSLDGTTAGIVDVEDRPSTSSSVALTASEKATLTTSVNVKSTAGNVYGMSAVNGAATVCWVQFINNASTGTLGTGVIFSIPLPASGVVNLPPGALALSNFSSGIAVGIATTATGASACGTAGNVTVFYN